MSARGRPINPNANVGVMLFGYSTRLSGPSLIRWLCWLILIGMRRMGLIAHLPKSLIAHLRSSFILPNLAQAMEELICNSLDAGAKRICASFDLSSLYIKVEDDGSGINRDDFSLIGERNATSKLHSLTDLETGITTLGFRGEALSSLSEIAILEITSRARGSPNTYKKIVKGSKKLSMGICCEQRAPGTSVVLRDLFHNLPVRRKVIQSSPRKVLQAIKDAALRLALIHSDVSFTVTDLERQEDLISTRPCVSSLNTLCEFFGEELRHELLELNYSKENLKLYGFVSKSASRFPSKAVQFLYLNRRFINKTPMHKLMNVYSSMNKGFGELSRQPKCMIQERKNWMLDTSSNHIFPAFLLNLSCPHSYYDITLEASKTSVEFKDWDSILSFVKEALDTVWNRSTRFLDEGGMEDLSGAGLVVPRKSSSRKRKSWQLVDPTYNPRFKVNVANTHISDNDSCLKGFSACFNHAELPQSDSKRRDRSSKFQCYYDFPNSSWDLNSCMKKRAIHVNNSRTLRSKTKHLQPLEANIWEVKDDAFGIETSNFHSKLKVSQGGFVKGMLEYREPNELVKEALQLEDNSSASFSRESVENFPFYADNLGIPSVTETIPLDSQRSKTLNAEFTEYQNDFLVDFDRDGNAALEDEKTPVSSWKPGSSSRNCVRRRLYDLCLKSRHTDDFLCHSERQSVSNLVFRENLDRERRLLERNGQSDSSINLSCDRIQGNHLSQQKLVSFTADASADSSQAFGIELDEFNQHDKKHQQSAKGIQRLFHSIYDESPSLSEWKDLNIIEPRSASEKSLFQENAEDNIREEVIKGQHEKHISSRERPLWPPKCYLKRSSSAPPFFKPLRKYALHFDSIHGLPKRGEDQIEELKASLMTAGKRKCSRTIGEAQQKNSIAALEGSVISQKRMFQETTMSRQHVPQGISKAFENGLSSPVKESDAVGNDDHRARRGDNSILSLDLEEENTYKLTTQELYKEWRNPCIKKYEKDILDLSSGILGPMNKQLLPESISKEMLQNARVLQQLGKKFIAIVAEGILVVVDQHAADERIRLEQLRKEVLVESKKQLTTLLDQPQKLIVTMGDQQLLHTYRSQIQDWGWRFKAGSFETMVYDRSHPMLNKGNSVVVLNAVPQVLGEILSDGSYLSEYLRQLAMTDGTSAPPPAVLRVLASKACRGAIMFGDFLLRSECQQLIEGLKQTALCFQCAHGRPTLVPLVNLKALHQRLGGLSYRRTGAFEAICEPVSADQSCNLTEPHKASTEGTIVWHGLQWHRPTLKRAQERLKQAQGM